MNNTLIIYNINSADAIASAAILYGVCNKEDTTCNAIGIPRTWDGSIKIGEKGWKYDINMSREDIIKYNSFAKYDIYIIGFFTDPYFMSRVVHERKYAHYYFIMVFDENYKEHIKLVVERLNLKGLKTNSQMTTYYNDRITVYTSKNWSCSWFTFKRELGINRKPMSIRYINDYTMKTNKFKDSKFFVEYILNSELVYADNKEWEYILKGKSISNKKNQNIYDSEWANTINKYIETVKNSQKEEIK